MPDDYNDEILPRLKQSVIYHTFGNSCEEDGDGAFAKSLVLDVIKYCYQRSKTVISHMNEYTLHDADHLFHVLYIMGKLIPEDILNKLTVPELMLLLLSAFFHDIGMAPDELTVLAWKKNWDFNPTFDSEKEKNEYFKFRKYFLSHPRIVEEIDRENQIGEKSKADQLKSYFISEYIRSTHADRTKDALKDDWNGKILYHDVDMTVEFAGLCKSHCEDAMLLTRMDYTYLSGQVCLPFIGVILRLADILDFDSKRTPAILFSHLYVRNPVSLKEWKKHRSVESWIIKSDIISFQAKCTHPAIEASIHDFCDIIDNELKLCNNILGDIPSHDQHRAIVFKLPIRIARDKITTQKDIDEVPVYYFMRTQFMLSKKQVVELLMGTKLYGNPEVALRELIQNSIDACLLRGALEAKWGNEYKPRIEIKYYHQNDDDFLEVNDNGVGMDQEIVDKYYSKIGSSFYTSADFYDIRAECDSDFVPRSRFGIGILSCFMVADTIITDTKKIKGPSDSSEALNITIEGQDSIFWVKKGDRQNVGTNTCLILRKKRHPWEKMSNEDFIDSVKRSIPNPPFLISIKTDKINDKIDEKSFYKYSIADLKDYNWKDHENHRQIDVNIDRMDIGFVSILQVGLLEEHDMPTRRISVKSKDVSIDGEIYSLEKEMTLSDNKIELISTSITINDDENIESKKLTSTIAESKSRVSLHGIEIPMSLFPRSWESKTGQAILSWPFPVLIILDVGGTRDLNLNSSRSQILNDEKWSDLEEDLAMEVCLQIKRKVDNKYWEKLLPIIQETSNELFLNGLKRVEDA
jgi:hypothetical protein